ncbi:MAG TPA: 6-hydroxymethylpterin diphosphokinase MptE-like protein [Tepidisphaeraceae bacterium]|nr:6-hydroxymethylpterin diphosphokinase MptE-like protein [Tepidisphaeraceae bacterium]
MTARTDPSGDHVLSGDAPLVRNLAALWATEPRLAREIEALAEGPYTIEPSRCGAPTVVVASSGRDIYLHSRHQPVDEANRLVAHLDCDERVCFFIHGLGLGYHVEAIFDQASDEAVICIVEPDLRMIRTALEARDLARLIESRRVMLLTKVDKSEVFVRLAQQMAMFSMGCETIEHGPSVRLRPQEHAQFREWLEEFTQYSRTSINTLVINGRRTAENVARNIGWYAATPSLARLKDKHKGAPAIIVSAGPSLRKNKHLIKHAAGKAVIVAVQTTLQPLLELGVEPNYVTSLDYHEICTRFFEKLPPTLRTELVAEPKATTAIFGMNPGPISLLGNDFAESLLREMKLDKARLPSGATVAHLAYYLAEHLGCDPIIFVGQDLGFSDGLCYAPGTSYDDVWRPELSRFHTLEMKQWETIVGDRKILRRIPDHQGRPMYTEERLFTYLQQFERDFLRTRTRIIDATEGGARKRGTTPMPLASAIESFCKTTFDTTAEDHPGLRWDLLEECIGCLQRRHDEAVEVETISRDTMTLLEEVRDSLADQVRVNRVISQIDALRARMNTLGPTYDLIMQLSQLTELARFHADRKITASRIEGLERQRRQVMRDIHNVRGVSEAAREFQLLMRQVIVHLSEPLRELKRGAA